MDEKAPYNALMESIASSLHKAIDGLYNGEFEFSDIEKSVELSRSFGDISSTIALRIAKAKGLDTHAIASGIMESMKKPDYISEITEKNGFINFTIDRDSYSRSAIAYALSSDHIFASDKGTGKKAIIEYPSINPAHPMHMGQVRNVLLGDSIARLYACAGYKVEREDYIDDLGLQVAEVIWGLAHMDKLGIVFDSNRKFDTMIGEIYVAVNKALDNKEIKDEINNVLVSMDQDGTYEAKAAREMAESFVKAEYDTLLEMGIYHDVLVWESDIVRKRLLEKALAKMDEKGIIAKPKDGDYANCIIIEHSKLGELPKEFEGLKEGVKVLVRSNGAPNYVSKDIAFHMWKLGLLEDSFSYGIFMEQGQSGRPLYSTGKEGSKAGFGAADIAINTIDARQSYEQSLVRLVIAMIGGKDYSESIKHVAYGVVDLEGISLSGRKGTWVGYTCDDLIREAKEKASALITDRFNLSEGEKADVIKAVALSAIKYEFLKLSNEKKLVFSWERALNFEGDSGPYCEYMHARAERILESAGNGNKRYDIKNGYSFSSQEFELVKRISYANIILEKAVRECKPNIVVEYLMDLSTSFGKFYEAVPILKAESDDIRESRLAITQAFARLSSELLDALGITAVKRM